MKRRKPNLKTIGQARTEFTKEKTQLEKRRIEALGTLAGQAVIVILFSSFFFCSRFLFVSCFEVNFVL